MNTSEELREALLNLEKARKREENQHYIAESLLNCLRVIIFTEEPHELFNNLFNIMREPLGFEAAFVLIMDDKGIFKPEATSDKLFAGTEWQPKSMFKRVIAGQPVVAFDTEPIEEWRTQSEAVRKKARSALHFSMHTTERKAIFICTHSNGGHFSYEHLLLARRFSMLATQALQKLDFESKLAYLKEKLETKAKLAALDRKLIESEKKLVRAKKMEALGLLASGVAHDLNNILSGIVGYPELLLMDENLSDDQRKTIEEIHNSGLRAASVVQDLLTVARGIASSKKPINLNILVKKYLRSPEYTKLINIHSDIMVSTNLDSELLNIKASRVHIEKVLMNLVSNAMEAIKDNYSGRIEISTKNSFIDKPLKGYENVNVGEYIVLIVSDNGSGISEEDLDRIFEPFYAKKTIGRSGTGLGLTIVWNTMQDHNGYINVTSSKNGTTFTLYFPITRNSIIEQDSEISIKNYKGNRQKILVIDDLEQQREIASKMLTTLGYTVNTVSGGEEAVEYLKRNTADIIVLDMIMDPGINGYETYKRIIKIHPNQKAIITSGFSQSEHVKAAQELGAGRYIKKPYTLEKIGIAVKEELGF